MSSAIRPPVTLAAAMLVIGLPTGAAFLVSAQFVSARDGLLSAPDICTTTGSEVTGSFADVTVGGLNEVKVFRTDNFQQVATIQVGNLPHGVWPSSDGTRIYVGLENSTPWLPSIH